MKGKTVPKGWAFVCPIHTKAASVRSWVKHRKRLLLAELPSLNDLRAVVEADEVAQTICIVLLTRIPGEAFEGYEVPLKVIRRELRLPFSSATAVIIQPNTL